MRQLTEGIIHLREINRLAINERVKKEHPGNIHLWWNRSPIESSARLLKTILEENSQEARDCQESTPSDLTIVDPFSGSGCLALAATRSGLTVLAGDLNSVAVVITKAITEIPARFMNCPSVFPEAEIQLYIGTTGLANDIRLYGEWIRQELGKRLTSSYPNAVTPDENGIQPYAWIWTRTAPCPNPACSCRMPLANSFVLSRQKGREYHVEPVVKDQIDFIVRPGAPEHSLNGNKIGKQGAQFQCPKCGSITKDEYIKSIGRSGKLGLQLMAIGFISNEGRFYKSPDKEQIQAAEIVSSLEVPAGDIAANTRWFSPPLFGLQSYADLYTPRQQLLMITLCDLVGEAQERCRKDALAAGMRDDNESLEDGGSGALAYSQAIALYLSLVVGKVTNFQSEICTWDNRNGNLRATFTRQAIPMTWTFAEGNLFSTVTGNFNSMLSDVVSSVKNLSCCSVARVVKQDALKFPFPHNSLLFTELPYYDNVGYADLSDYFYIWFRKCLKGSFSGLFDQIVSSKEELSSIPEHFAGDSQLALQSYEEGIRCFLQHFRIAATKEYPSLLFFEFGQQDEAVLSSIGEQERPLSHWENLIDGLLQADFQIVAILPVRTEVPNERYKNSRVAVAFLPREENASQTTRRSAITEIKKKMPKQMKEYFNDEIDECDLPIMGMGFGLSVVSKYSFILNADGSRMSVQDMLKVIWAEVSEQMKSLASNTILKEENHNG